MTVFAPDPLKFGVIRSVFEHFCYRSFHKKRLSGMLKGVF